MNLTFLIHRYTSHTFNNMVPSELLLRLSLCTDQGYLISKVLR